MNELTVEFSARDGKEYIALSGAFMGKDVAVREVTEADRRQYSAEYDAWKNPPVPATTTTLKPILVGGKVG